MKVQEAVREWPQAEFSACEATTAITGWSSSAAMVPYRDEVLPDVWLGLERLSPPWPTSRSHLTSTTVGWSEASLFSSSAG
jgi:hypothetical protein